MKRDRFQPFEAPPSLGMTLVGVESDSWMRGLRAIKVSPLGGGSYYLGIDLESPECERIIGVLEQEGRVPQSSHFNLYISEHWWKTPDTMWVAAEFVADPWGDISPANTFDPSCPPPCFGLVPSRLPLHVLSQPRGMVADVKFEIIFSEQLAAFLASLAPCQFGEVHLDNKPLRSHRRLFPQQLRKVFAADLMTTVPCAACGSPILTHRGALVGRRINDLVVCRNEEGIWHMAAEQPVIISVDVAVELKKRFPRGFGLDPILDINSSLGQRIVQLFRRLQALEVFRDPGREEQVSRHFQPSQTRLDIKSDDDIPL